MVDQTKGIGCGACATGCEEGSIRMVRRPEEEITRLDAELKEGSRKMLSMTSPDPVVLKKIQERL